MCNVKTKYELLDLLAADPNKQKLRPIRFIEKDKDPNHVERRHQQRAISEVMVQICLLYGAKKWIHGALTYTLSDRSLFNTPYYRHIELLRGLRVVCLEGDNYSDQFYILTVCWFFEFKKKKINIYEKRSRNYHRSLRSGEPWGALSA